VGELSSQLELRTSGSAWTHAFDAALNEVRFSFLAHLFGEGARWMPTRRSRELPAVTIVDADGPKRSSQWSFRKLAVRPVFPAAGKFISFGSDTRSTRVNNSLFQLQENLSFSPRNSQLEIRCQSN